MGLEEAFSNWASQRFNSIKLKTSKWPYVDITWALLEIHLNSEEITLITFRAFI